MAIVKMNKFTLFAFENEKEVLLENLQKFEGVQFVDLQPRLENEELSFLKSATRDKEILQSENELSKIKFCLDFLKPYMEKESGIEALKKGKKIISFDELEQQVKNINWISIYEELKEKEEKQNSFSNERTKIEAEIETLLPWSNFDCSLDQVKNLKYTSCFLGTIPTNLKDSFTEEFEKELDYSYLEFINEGKDEVYLLAIVIKKLHDKGIEILKKYGFTKVSFNYDESPDNIIKSYKNRIKQIENEKEKIEKSLKNLNDYQEKLQLVYEYYSNKLDRAKASSNFIRTNNIIAIQGWNTTLSNEEFEETIKEVVKENYYLEFEEAKEGDKVPILLKNNGFVEPFESITEMYSLPNYKEVDPTPIMSVFYFIFFGMMLSDAGYGIVMVVGTALALKFFKLQKGTKNFMKLFLYLGISTTVWGAIYGGWFGDAPEKFLGTPAPRLLNPSSDIMKIFSLAIVLGVIHILIGLGMKAYVLIRDKKYLDAVFDVGLWYVSLAGIFMIYKGLPAGKIVMIIGFVGLVLTQGRDAETIGGKIGGGIYGLYGITGYIGDIVSYSRLLALGLATGFIANAFNLMINLIPAGIPRIIAGIIIFLVGHLFNLGINALGSYVHTSRLQYLEFFNKFYEGGGKKFTPFKSTNKFVNITNKKVNVN
ncbi:V-type ATP synthase subunit I [Clostridium ganghwense]|uniref:V-type ATP synthase subunit I n=1 Tax=Clostridium ganghwense TaxID=312089 RepID=A0ABT4CS91_9CLOT|nr:V-type ATP synthase subunit I [Clostridium ganghwense]MCY6370844.1 V-type ATP synthase subunit I [Clostridium ganghwense]